jgi:hypothetical protein
MVPARQNLESREVQRPQIHHRLKARGDGITLDGVADFGRIDQHAAIILCRKPNRIT